MKRLAIDGVKERKETLKKVIIQLIGGILKESFTRQEQDKIVDYIVVTTQMWVKAPPEKREMILEKRGKGLLRLTENILVKRNKR